MTIISPIITLDGPSGTGKGTLCHRLANKLAWHALDSGAIYRVLAYASTYLGILPTDINALVLCARNLDLRFEGVEERFVLWQGDNISEAIRTESCGQLASKIAAIPVIRASLLERIRAFARSPGLVTDGRDMGTVVFPHANLKFYLDASQEARSMRRYLQLNKNKIHVTLSEVACDLAERDARDSQRSIAPLVPAADAVIIDTTTLSVDAVFEQLCDIVQKSGFLFQGKTT